MSAGLFVNDQSILGSGLLPARLDPPRFIGLTWRVSDSLLGPVVITGSAEGTREIFSAPEDTFNRGE